MKSASGFLCLPRIVQTGSGYVWLSLLLLLGGCASTNDSSPEWAGVKNEDDPAKLVKFDEKAKFKVRWHRDVGDAEANLLQFALNDTAIYTVSAEGFLSRLDRVSGKKVWGIKTGISVSAGVGSGEGVIVIGGTKGEVVAYDEMGKLLWQDKVSSEALSVSEVTEGVVVVRSGDGRIAGLNASNGQRLWVFERSTPALVVRSHAGVTIQRGVAFAGFAGGKLAAIRISNGEVLWETAVSQARGNTELERISDITSNPVVDDEQVCAVAFQGRLACYDITRGGAIWNREVSSDKGMVLLRKYLYLTDAKGAVSEMDKNTGNTLWKNDQLFMRDVSTPYVTEDFVMVSDAEGYLYALSREDGSFAARMELDGGAVKATMRQQDDGFLVLTNGGELYSLSIK